MPVTRKPATSVVELCDNAASVAADLQALADETRNRCGHRSISMALQLLASFLDRSCAEWSANCQTLRDEHDNAVADTPNPALTKLLADLLLELRQQRRARNQRCMRRKH